MSCVSARRSSTKVTKHSLASASCAPVNVSRRTEQRHRTPSAVSACEPVQGSSYSQSPTPYELDPSGPDTNLWRMRFGTMSQSQNQLSTSQSSMASTSSGHRFSSVKEFFMRGLRPAWSSSGGSSGSNRVGSKKSASDTNGFQPSNLSQRSRNMSQSHDSLIQETPTRPPVHRVNLRTKSTGLDEHRHSMHAGLVNAGTQAIRPVNGSRIVNMLRLTVIEAKGIPDKKRYFCELCLDQKYYGRTSSKLKSDICLWSEQFDYNNLPSVERVSLDLYKHSRTEKATLIGYILFDADSVRGSKANEQWYPIIPVDKSWSKGQTTPAIRVKAHYITLHILPLRRYGPLLNYLESNYITVCKTFEPSLTAKSKEDLATSLVQILHHLDKAPNFLCDLIMLELETLQHPQLMFRGNTLGSKAMEAYMKLVGQRYLELTLGDCLRSVIQAGDDCEVDADKLNHSYNSLEKAQSILTQYTELVWAKIRHSAQYFPVEMLKVFSMLRVRLADTGRANLVECLVSSCLFLRYICPAVMSPSLFGLVSVYPDERSGRNLTLVAKSLQTLANFAKFGGKEQYMEFMNWFVEKEWNNMREFLKRVSTPSPERTSGFIKFDGLVDIGQEMSMLHSHLAEYMGGLNPQQKHQLRELCIIVDRLDGVETAAPMSIPEEDARRVSDYENVDSSEDNKNKPSEKATLVGGENVSASEANPDGGGNVSPLRKESGGNNRYVRNRRGTWSAMVEHMHAADGSSLSAVNLLDQSSRTITPLSLDASSTVVASRSNSIRYIDDASSTSDMSSPDPSVSTEPFDGVWTKSPISPDSKTSRLSSVTTPVATPTTPLRTLSPTSRMTFFSSGATQASPPQSTVQTNATSAPDPQRQAISNPMYGVMRDKRALERTDRSAEHATSSPSEVTPLYSRPRPLSAVCLPQQSVKSKPDGNVYPRISTVKQASEDSPLSVGVSTGASSSAVMRERVQSESMMNNLAQVSMRKKSVRAEAGINTAYSMQEIRQLERLEVEKELEQKFAAEREILMRQIEETKKRLNVTEQSEFYWKSKYEKIAPKIVEIQHTSTKMQKLAESLHDSERKDHVIKEQHKQITSLKAAYSSLMSLLLNIGQRELASAGEFAIPDPPDPLANGDASPPISPGLVSEEEQPVERSISETDSVNFSDHSDPSNDSFDLLEK